MALLLKLILLSVVRAGCGRLWGKRFRHRCKHVPVRCDGDVLSPTLAETLAPQPASRAVPIEVSGLSAREYALLGVV